MTHIKLITLVDDDEVFVFLTKSIIKQTQIPVKISTFGNGFDALQFIKENYDKVEVLPEVILLDLSMPIMNGWQFLNEFCRIAPRAGKKITVYICSSSISPDDVARAKTYDTVSDYIIKPVTKDKLLTLLSGIE